VLFYAYNAPCAGIAVKADLTMTSSIEHRVQSAPLSLRNGDLMQTPVKVLQNVLNPSTLTPLILHQAMSACPPALLFEWS
jgi:hypothetical protein